MLRQFIQDQPALAAWLGLFLVAGFVAAIAGRRFKARKIQPGGFRWKILRKQANFAGIAPALAGTFPGYLTSWLTDSGVIGFHKKPIEKRRSAGGASGATSRFGESEGIPAIPESAI